VGVGVVGVGVWGLGPIPQSPIPNPQSPIPNPHRKNKKITITNKLYIKYNNFYNYDKNKKNKFIYKYFYHY
jgi:hypothetical protein